MPFHESHRGAFAAFAAATLMFVLLHVYHDVRWLWHDAKVYWDLADLPNYFSVGNNIRGYLLALLLAPARFLVDATGSPWPFRLMSSAAYAWALTSLVPQLYLRLFGGTLSPMRRLIPALLTLVLFPGLLVFPLSDLAAFLMMCGAFMALHTALRGADAGRLPLRWLCIAGALTAGAYNTRSIYLFVLWGLLLVLATRSLRAGWSGRRLLEAAVLGASALAVLMPQAAVNLHIHGQFTLNPAILSSGRSLFLSQLQWGLEVQRYETAVVGREQSFGISYPDAAGKKLARSLGTEIPFRSVPQYLVTAASHPLDFLGLYTRHVVNGLDLRDGLLYTERRSATRDGIAQFNFLVLALAVWLAALRGTQFRSRGSGDALATRNWPIWLGLWLLPVLLIVPGAIETRFFAPLHLMAYCAVACHFDARALAASLRRHPFAIPAALLGAAGLFFALTLSTMATV